MAGLIYLFLVIYLISLVLLLRGFIKINKQRIVSATAFKKFSLVIVYRNENKNLLNLLNSFKNLDYPLENFEILMIDDGSVETFDFMAYQLPIKSLKNIRKTASPKKDAITFAVDCAKNDWLVFTDADCVVDKLWLKTLNNYLQANTEKEMVCGSVFVDENINFLSAFQAWDFVSLQATTIGSFGLNKPFMCNSANMAFTKTIFKKVDGYVGNNHWTSGDDVFLLQKIFAVEPQSLGYLFHPNFFIKTKAVESFEQLINQRVRWGSKAKAYSSIWGKFLSLLIVCVSLIFIWRLIVLNYWFVLIKLVLDGSFLVCFSKLFKQKINYLLPSLLIYPFVVVWVLGRSFFKIEWKS